MLKEKNKQKQYVFIFRYKHVESELLKKRIWAETIEDSKKQFNEYIGSAKNTAFSKEDVEIVEIKEQKKPRIVNNPLGAKINEDNYDMVVIPNYGECSLTRYKQYVEEVNRINDAFKKASDCYLQIAIAINEVNDKKLFRIENSGDIYEFTEKKYCMARGTTSNYINIVKKFCMKDKSGEYMPQLKKEYEEFNCSQLIILLPVFEDKILMKRLKPEMSTRAMKQAIKEYKDEKKAVTAPDTTAPDTTAPDTTAPDTTAPTVFKLTDIDFFINNMCEVEEKIIELLTQGKEVLILEQK